MRKRCVQLAAVFFSVAVLGFWGHRAIAASPAAGANDAMGQGRQKALGQRLEDLVGQLRELRSSYYSRKARDNADIRQAEESQQVLRRQLEDLRRQEAEVDQQIAQHREDIRTIETQLQRRTVLREAVAKNMAVFVPEQEAQIRAGISYRRQERIDRLKAGIANVGGLSQLWSYAQEELRLAGSSETYSDRAVTEDGASPHARYFRVGQLILGYVTEDGRHVAMWQHVLPEGRWMSVTDPAQAAQVRHAVEILDRRQAPEFVFLPVLMGAGEPEPKGP